MFCLIVFRDDALQREFGGIMGKICFSLLICGAVTALFGWEAGSQNTVFVGALLTFSGGAGIDRIMRAY